MRRPTMKLVGPSGPLEEPAVVDRARERLEARGWRLLAAEGTTRRFQRFAGTDEQRLSELVEACLDPGVDVVCAMRGGYGMTRLLSRIDFDAIRAAGRVVCGFSDFTAFNLALLARGGVSLQGPTVADLAVDHRDPWTLDTFLDTVTRAEAVFRFATPSPDTTAGGTLWGGNLAMICSLVGTRFLPDVREGILVLEDVHEAPYRVERMLFQLLHAGVLERQRVIVLGDFTVPNAPVAADAPAYGLDDAFARIAGELPAGVRLIRGLPFGHGPRRLTLPVGGQALLEVLGGQASLQVSGYPYVANAEIVSADRSGLGNVQDRKFGPA